MEKMICQSCTMPLDNIDDRGTETDGSKSDLYCKYCYMNGAFTEPELTFGQMKVDVTAEMYAKDLPAELIQRSVETLSGLKRWKTQAGPAS